MTLTGQEARIQVRYHMPDHPQVELYTQLCSEYKQLSEKQLERHRDEITKVRDAKEREKRLDAEFTARLAEMEDDGVDTGQPYGKRNTAQRH